MSPRPKQPPAGEVAELLRAAGEQRVAADAQLRAAVLAAVDAGGSIREVARLGQLSTHTVQQWLRDR